MKGARRPAKTGKEGPALVERWVLRPSPAGAPEPRLTKRKRHSAEFKAKVASEALREDLAAAERAKKDDIHPAMITGWKRTATLSMALAFGGATPIAPRISAGGIEKLHAKIGRPVVERDCLSAASGLVPDTGGKRR